MTGEPLFKNDHEDNLGLKELRRLGEWDEEALEDALQLVDTRSDILARDILHKLLLLLPQSFYSFANPLQRKHLQRGVITRSMI